MKNILKILGSVVGVIFLCLLFSLLSSGAFRLVTWKDVQRAFSNDRSKPITCNLNGIQKQGIECLVER